MNWSCSMMLIEETTVPDAVLPVDEFKAHLRVGSGFGTDTLQDEVLQGFLRAAMAAIESRTGKMLLLRDFSWNLTMWRDLSAQALPIAPVAGITSLELVSRDGSRDQVPDDLYWLEQDQSRPRVRSVGVCLPKIPNAGSVIVNFRAGFGEGWTDIPADLRQAVMLLAAHYFEYRNETSLGDRCMPFGVSSLIERYKVLRLSVGSTSGAVA
jgi:uncharacterized phiE125 gp8 family phage protein